MTQGMDRKGMRDFGALPEVFLRRALPNGSPECERSAASREGLTGPRARESDHQTYLSPSVLAAFSTPSFASEGCLCYSSCRFARRCRNGYRDFA